MRTTRNELLEALIQQTQTIKKQVQAFQDLDKRTLNFKETPKRWSILECLEHLNLYGDFYLPEIEKQLIGHDPAPQASSYKAGILGNYFANSMRPGENGKISKMTTFKDKDPADSNLPVTTIDRFLKQQDQMIKLLELARNYDIQRIKTAITIPLLKLRLGDSFRVVIYHNERHLLQAQRVLHTFRGLEQPEGLRFTASN